MNLETVSGRARIADVTTEGSEEERLVTSLDREESERIESEVREIMASVPGYVWDGHSLPVPIAEIAREVYGLRVVKVDRDQMKEVAGISPEEGDVSGMLLTNIGEIWINSWEAGQDTWGHQRTRFTVGHELGHFVMHQTRSPRILCRSSAAEENLDQAPVPRVVPEVEANTFSAALLMPVDVFRKHLEDCGGESGQDQLQEAFGVSRKAAWRRIQAVKRLD